MSSTGEIDNDLADIVARDLPALPGDACSTRRRTFASSRVARPSTSTHTRRRGGAQCPGDASSPSTKRTPRWVKVAGEQVLAPDYRADVAEIRQRHIVLTRCFFSCLSMYSYPSRPGPIVDVAGIAVNAALGDEFEEYLPARQASPHSACSSPIVRIIALRERTSCSILSLTRPTCSVSSLCRRRHRCRARVSAAASCRRPSCSV